MKKRYDPLKLIWCVVAVGVLAACGSATPPVSSPGTMALPPTTYSSPTATSTPSPSTSASVDQAQSVIKGNFDLVDPSRGYTYRVKFAFSGLTKPTKSIKDAAPGYTEVSVGVGVHALEVKNTTSGRTLPGSSVGAFEFRAGFPDGGPICEYFSGRAGMGSHPDSWIVLPSGKKYCVIRFGDLSVGRTDTPPDGTATDASVAGTQALTITVKDELVEKAIGQFSKPEFYLVATSDRLAQSKDCPIAASVGGGSNYLLVSEPPVISTCKDGARS